MITENQLKRWVEILAQIEVKGQSLFALGVVRQEMEAVLTQPVTKELINK